MDMEDLRVPKAQSSPERMKDTGDGGDEEREVHTSFNLRQRVRSIAQNVVDMVQGIRYRHTGEPQGVSVREKRDRWSGWRFGVRACGWTSSAVLSANVILTVVLAAKFGSTSGIGTAYYGDCSVANSLNTWLHILINVLSSVLLSASNYTMQVLAAPTRQEIDKAHSKGDWLDTGTPSLRNMLRIRWPRVVSWIVLGLSSVPIHLLYNSAIFKTIESNEYLMAVVTPDWMKNGGNLSINVPWSGSPGDQAAGTDLSAASQGTPSAWDVLMPYNMDYLLGVQRLFAENHENTTMFTRMDNADCISAYSSTFQEAARKCDTKKVGENADNWAINGKRIDYCLSQDMPPRCELQFSVSILAAVIACNVFKTVAMFLTLYAQKGMPIVTVGDAVAAFLEEPDPCTAGRCLASRVDLLGLKQEHSAESMPKVFSATDRSVWLASAASGKRWAITFGLTILWMSISAFLLSMATRTLGSTGVSPYALGFGAIDSRALIDLGLPSAGTSGLISAILLANLPQAIVSCLYLLYNGLLTVSTPPSRRPDETFERSETVLTSGRRHKCLFSAQEWSNYAHTRKSLRVSSPCGQQRGTYYLQLPLRYSVPLIAISVVLHWFISQAIFLARVNVFDNGEASVDDISQVGYSCAPILGSILIGAALLLGALAAGFTRFRTDMPVAGSCSLAISAACHAPNSDQDAAYLPVMWGETVVQESVAEGIGH
ncbi:hypothetical protein Slin15195_G007350 [Septoria linicola]|uniref:DUF6536 domain-containing protein n=1 Tax=Septoria linicola TaxID=215465 RepID=A0A9Q9ED56_9PEZI|nr:hypothetical protein Slin14017_G007360 [Septoria linicola]USW47416.1 hypothetical protein Slin15195_G007350 [Septoria linicola]